MKYNKPKKIGLFNVDFHYSNKISFIPVYFMTKKKIVLYKRDYIKGKVGELISLKDTTTFTIGGKLLRLY